MAGGALSSGGNRRPSPERVIIDEAPGRIRVGVDIGGTFTDLALVTEDGRVEVGKVLTTPDDPSRGVEEVLGTVLDRERMAGVSHLVHGTTLVTNAIIERKGAATALVTSEGFRDAVEIGKEHRYELYDLMLEHPAPIVPRHLRFSVPERTYADGATAIELDEDHLSVLASELAAAGIEAVAVSFLHSFTNPEPERRAREVIAVAAPQMRVSISSEVVPELGEFERTSTTIANVYVQPLVEQYLTELESRLERNGFGGRFFAMLSSGGIATLETCVQFPIRMLESGPAAGAIAAAAVGVATNRNSLLSFDMGGTTAKLSVVDEGEPLVTHDFEVDRRYRFKKGSGLPIQVPVVEMIEIGAGGGSIARIDDLGLLKVGPDSAGSDPGPSCYGLGGSLPTVTDADLVLGYLDPDYFLGGAMKLDRAAAGRAIEAGIASRLGLTLEEAAWGIHQVVNENMANAARVHVIERGKNPRGLPVVAFGGAGPVHGYRVAALLGSPELVLPPGAGVASASGLLSAPLAFDFARSFYGKLDALDWGGVNAVFADMERHGTELLVDSGLDPGLVSHRRVADVRYVGQGHAIRVNIPAGTLSEEDLDEIRNAFDREYRNLYGREGPPVGLEALTWRVVSSGPRPGPASVPRPGPGTAGPPTPRGERQAYLPEASGFATLPVYDRYALLAGAAFEGPAIIEERESTAVIGPDATVVVDDQLNLVVTLDAGALP